MSQRNLRRHFSKYLVATALALGSAGSLGMALHAPPARAQITVFDPSNYSQNLLTAARTLQQINNQIQSLQNQATMLTNQAKNLSRIDFPELQAQQATNQLLALTAKQQFQIQTLMAAQYRAEAIERANQAQSRTDAQSASAKFLGSGSAYTPQ